MHCNSDVVSFPRAKARGEKIICFQALADQIPGKDEATEIKYEYLHENPSPEAS